MKRMNQATHKELSTMHLGLVSLDWSHHASERAEQKGIRPAYSLDVVKGSIVELEMTHAITKLVVRVSYTTELDVIYVLVPLSKRNWKVVTAWTNHVNDNHSTLNMQRIA